MGPGRTSRAWYFHTAASKESVYSSSIWFAILAIKVQRKIDDKAGANNGVWQENGSSVCFVY